MGEVKIKEISTFEENNKTKTKMVFVEDNAEKEIVFEGNGSLKVAAGV